MNKKKKILILNGQYSPGYKGGGPIQSCINMVENLYDQYDFYVLCADRDLNDTEPYSNILINQWVQVDNAKVYYASPDKLSFNGIKDVLNNLEYDILYLNGFFSPFLTIKPLILRRLGLLKDKIVILTPRGDFTGGCENKKLKKYIYIYLVKIIGLYSNILWHATSELEKQSILKKFRNSNIFVAPNLPAKFKEKTYSINKEQGELKLIFVSRIFPKKNLKFALQVLKEIKQGKVVFDIYGPLEDKEYWNECQSIIKEMPSNIKVNYYGEVNHSQISGVFQKYHAFFFPTLGENYGHVIVEAMMNGCLCILSKGVTPWDDYIEKLNCGATLPNIDGFKNIINKFIDMNQDEINNKICINNKYIQDHTNVENIIVKYIEMLK